MGWQTEHAARPGEAAAEAEATPGLSQEAGHIALAGHVGCCEGTARTPRRNLLTAHMQTPRLARAGEDV